MQRVDLRVANKRTLESIVLSGGFDLFELKRYQYFSKEDNGQTYIERMIRFGNRIQDSRNSNQFDMFGDIQVYYSSSCSIYKQRVDCYGIII